MVGKMDNMPRISAATELTLTLTLGRRGNRLAGEVRTWRNEGKRAIDLKADLLAPAGGAS